MKISELPIPDMSTAADNNPIEIPATVNGSTYKVGNEFLGRSAGGYVGRVDNCNALTNGHGYTAENTQNAPQSYGTIFSSATGTHGLDGGDWRGQIFITSDGNKIYFRGGVGGSWSSWKELATK